MRSFASTSARVAVLLVPALAACGSSSKASPAFEDGAGGAGGGGGSQTGVSGTGGGAGASSSGQPTTTCTNHDAADVIVLGTVSNVDGVAPLSTLTEPCAVRPYLSHPVVRPTDGKLVYVHGATLYTLGSHSGYVWGDLVQKWVPDPDASQFDESVPVGCPGAVTGLLLHPTTGAPTFQCADATVRDAAGALLDTAKLPIYAIGADGSFLGADTQVPHVIDSSGALRPTSGFTDVVDGQGGVFIYAARAVSDGFWMVVRATDGPESRRLWHVALTGESSFVGQYPFLPDGVTEGAIGHAALDATGRLVSVHADAGKVRLVRRVASPAAMEVLSEVDADAKINMRPVSVITGPLASETDR